MRLRPAFADRFRGMPIRRKLTVIFIVTTAIALLLAGLGIVAADSVLFYGYIQRDLSTFVRIIGDNSTAALEFRDAEVAGEILSALGAREHIQVACLYLPDGALLARYVRSGYDAACPPYESDGVRAGGDTLLASYRILLDGNSAGALVLRYDLGEAAERVRIYGITVLFSLLVSSVVALLLSSKLRAMVAEPILELVGAANAVSQSKDYGIRAKKHSNDEVGSLADALNQMLDVIQARDNDLRKALEAQRDALSRLAQLNSDLKRTNAELARSNQDLERFAFVASHDLQEPLRMITSYSQLLVSEASPDPSGRGGQYVEQIVGGTKRMRELLSDLLSYTEIAGSTEQPAQSVDLNVVLDKVKQTLAQRIQGTGAEVTSDVLPAVMGHEGRLTSLLLNLVGNAIKYRGEQPPRIRVSSAEDDNVFTISVADNGIGIAPEYHSKIFTAFKRLHGRDIPGTGIGLAICQRIVERYGGQIWVESEIGAGATFRFTLPKSTAGA